MIEKISNMSAGALLLLCGVAGCFFPDLVAAYYGFDFISIEAKTAFRAISGLFISTGYLLIHFAYQTKNQSILLFCVLIMLLCFMFPRVLGFLWDGGSQPKILAELVFEGLCAILFLFLIIKNKIRYNKL